MTDATIHPESGLEMLDKATAVLAHLAATGEQTVAEIAAASSEPVSSTYRLLSSLVALEWVEPGPVRGRYRLGTAALTIGGVLDDQLDLRAIALPALHRLRDRSGATAFLCVRRGDQAVCIERVEGHAVRSLRMRLGDGLPLFLGAAPLAILANLPVSERDATLRSAVEAGELDTEAAEDVRDRLDEVRLRGVARSDQDVTPGIAALGAPIRNHRGELAGSISISGLRASILDPAVDLGAAVAAEAAWVTAQLGGEEAR